MNNRLVNCFTLQCKLFRFSGVVRFSYVVRFSGVVAFGVALLFPQIGRCDDNAALDASTKPHDDVVVEMEGLTITGNEEQPGITHILSWRDADRGALPEVMLDKWLELDNLEYLERESFKRHVFYEQYQAR